MRDMKRTTNYNSKCTCCKKPGHNITTCVSVGKQGVLIENHIIGIQEHATSEIQFRIRLLQYLRNLSKTQQKILCTRIGESKISYSTVIRYLSYKGKSRKVMDKIYSVPVSVTVTSFPYDKIFSTTFSEKPERKKIFCKRKN
jgi:hypothetical protein